MLHPEEWKMQMYEKKMTFRNKLLFYYKYMVASNHLPSPCHPPTNTLPTPTMVGVGEKMVRRW